MAHVFWTCPSLRDFWSSVCKTLNEAFNTNVKPSADMAIFGVLINETMLPTDKMNAFAFASLICRRRKVLQWKSPDPPKVSVWLSELMFFLKLEKIKYFTRGSTKKFHKIWDPLILYFESLNTLPSVNTALTYVLILLNYRHVSECRIMPPLSVFVFVCLFDFCCCFRFVIYVGGWVLIKNKTKKINSRHCI